MTVNDQTWMSQALELAERGRGSVEPNPLVGAIVVRDGQLVGSGWHQRFGKAHAEIHALAQAGAAAQGATLYVTLEPCCHHGKTPPCTDSILRAGIGKVVVAMPDPFPKVSGQGIAQLKSAGIAVQIGPGAAEARRLNAPYLKLLGVGQPYVHAKWAMTLDGKIATRTGDSRWISNSESRSIVHQLRGRMDGILVGLGTVLADDPLLTARPPGPRRPTRIILDSQARLPATTQLAKTARETPVVIVAAETTNMDRCQELRNLGCELLALPSSAGRPSIAPLLDELGRRKMTNLLVEGGSEVLGSFLDADAIDEVHVFIASRLIGGRDAKSPFGGAGVERLTNAIQVDTWETMRLQGDLYLRGWKSAGREEPAQQ